MYFMNINHQEESFTLTATKNICFLQPTIPKRVL